MEAWTLTPDNLTVLICDDEEAGRDVLSFELEQIGVRRVITCASADEVLDRVQEGLPDIFFLDIQMPATNGIELARELARYKCHIVFITAYVGFAVQSYDVDALDFITKPVTSRKLTRALERSAARRLDQPEQPAGYLVRIQEGRHVQLLGNTEISCFLAEDKYVRVCADNRELLWRQTISGLQKMLQADFIRVHRSAIVNRNRIRRASSRNGRLELTLLDGRVLPVGKTFETEVRSVLERL